MEKGSRQICPYPLPQGQLPCRLVQEFLQPQKLSKGVQISMIKFFRDLIDIF